MSKLISKKVLKQALCVFLSIVLLFSMVPISSTWAENSSSSTETTTEQTQENSTDQNNSTSTDEEKKAESDDSKSDFSATEEKKQESDSSSSDTSKKENANSSDSSRKESNTSNQTSGSNSSSKEEQTKKATESNKLAQEAAKAEENAVATLQATVEPLSNGYVGTCRVGTFSGGLAAYFATLDDAIEYILGDNGADSNVIEVYADTTLASSHNITNKQITIKNINENITGDMVNPTKNKRSTGSQTVTWSEGNTKTTTNLPQISVSNGGQLKLSGSGKVTVEGAIFNGNSVSRASQVFVISGGSVVINDGADCADATKGITATKSEFTKLNITNNSVHGGWFYLSSSGSLDVNAGLFDNNKSAGYGSVIGHYAGGTTDISEDAGSTVFSGNSANKGGVLYEHGDSSSYTQIMNIHAGTFTGNSASGNGGVLYMLGDYGQVTIDGGTFTSNTCTTYGSVLSNPYGTLTIKGDTKIENNGACSTGAVYAGVNNRTGCYFKIEGSPRIVNNNGYNVYIGLVNRCTVTGDLTKDARIGICGKVAAGADFISISKTFDTTTYMACFSNDQNTTLLPVSSGTGTSAGKTAKWIQPNDGTNPYTCYINSAGYVKYYTTLQKAIEDAGTGTKTIEIFKSHHFSLGAKVEQEVNGTITIQNVNTPLNNAVDWTQNAVNGGNSPVVTFNAETEYGQTYDTKTNVNGTQDRILIADGKTLNLKGVIFDGNSEPRARSAFRCGATAFWNIYDGDEGVTINGSKCVSKTTLKNFKNKGCNNNDLDAGGLVLCYGTVNMEGGTVSGCEAESAHSGWTGGGAVACIRGGGTFNFNKGTITKCGTALWPDEAKPGWASNNLASGCFYACGGYFNMNGGEFYENVGVCGALAFANGSGTPADPIKLKGGKIHDNFSSYEGTVLFAGRGVTAAEISGGVEIYGNTMPDYSGGMISCRLSGSTITIGDCYIHDNNKTGTSPMIASLYNFQVNLNISGKPVIWDNYMNNGDRGDLLVTDKDKVIVSNLSKGAKIGVWGKTDLLNTEGEQFAVANGSTDAALANIAGSFVNDKNTSLLSVTTKGSTAITWGINATVKEITSAGYFVKYYSTLNAAIDGATSGNKLEILKTHAMTAAVETSKKLTIENIVSPANESEDPRNNGSKDAEPVVYFPYIAPDEAAPTVPKDAKITFTGGQTITLSGVIFDGRSWDGTNATQVGRQTNALKITGGGIIDLSNGSPSTYQDGTTRAACETELRNFYNAYVGTGVWSGTEYSKGEHLATVFDVGLNCTVNMISGTIKNNYTDWDYGDGDWKNGVNVGIIRGGTFNVKGGEICNNGKSDIRDASCHGYNCFRMAQDNSTFNMEDGYIHDNYGATGTIVAGVWRGSTTGNINNIIKFTGGTISGNWSSYRGVAYCASGSVSIGGTAKIINNRSYSCGVFNLARNNYLTCSLYGDAVISNNTCVLDAGAIASDTGTVLCPIYIKDRVVVYNNTGNGNQRNIKVENPNLITVGKMGYSAKIGVYSTTATVNGEGCQFATADTAAVADGGAAGDATNCGYLNAFYNDAVSRTIGGVEYPLRGVDGKAKVTGVTDEASINWEGTTPIVKVTEQTVATDLDGNIITGSDGKPIYSTTVHDWEHIWEAFECVKELGDDRYIQEEGKDYYGYIPVEMLVYDTKINAAGDAASGIEKQVTINTGANKKVMFTTAKANATDGFPYRGNGTSTTGEYANAKITWTGASAANTNPFYYSGASHVTTKKMTFDGGAVWGTNGAKGTNTGKQMPDYGGFWSMYNAAGGSLTFDEGTVVQNCDNSNVGAAYGGAVYVSGSGTFTMKGGATIKDCKSVYGGAMRANAGTTVNLYDSTIFGCVATADGGAIWKSYVAAAHRVANDGLVLKTGCSITDCQAVMGGAVYLYEGSLTANSNSMTAAGEVTITGNRSTAANEAYTDSTGDVKVYNGAIFAGTRDVVTIDEVSRVVYNAYNNTTIFLAGKVRITDNYVGSTGTTQGNIAERTPNKNNTSATEAAKNGTFIKVLENYYDYDDEGNITATYTGGLYGDAKVGINSTNNWDAGDVFGKTEAINAGTSNNSYNLNKFYNDRSHLRGTPDGEGGSGVMWGMQVPVKIYIHQGVTDDDGNFTEQAIPGEDRYYTLHLQGSTTGTMTRLVVKVPAGQTVGTVVGMTPINTITMMTQVTDACPSGVTLTPYAGCTYGGYTSASGYFNTSATSTVTPADDKALGFGGIVGAINATKYNTKVGEIASASGIREIHLKAVQTLATDEGAHIVDMGSTVNTINP